MSNFVKKGKKALSIGVTVTTVVWTLGLAALAPVAQAQTLAAGDLLQCDLKDAKCPKDRALYWFTADGKRLTFPNEKTFKTWYEDFKSVTIKQISFDELAAIPLAGNATYRPGTRLGKITTDPKTYVIAPGSKLSWVKTEADAKKLYGDNWGGWIDDIPDVFFGNYSVGENLDTPKLTDGRVVKTAASEDLYLVWGGKKRKIADFNAFKANRFNAAYISTVGQDLLDALPAGDGLTGVESATMYPWAMAAATGTAQAGAGTALTVSAEGTPAAATHASGSAYNDALKLKMTAGADGDVKVSEMIVRRGGFAADNAFSGVGLFDVATGKRYGNFVSFSDNKATISMSADPVVVSAGMTKEVMFKTNVTTAVAGQSGTYSLSVLPAEIKTVSTATVSAPAPLQGPTNSLTSGANSVANLNVDVVSLSTTAVSVDIGKVDHEVTRFRFQQVNGVNDINLKKLTLFNNGTAADEDLKDYKLVDLVTGDVLATTAKSSGRWFAFDLTAKPYLLKKGTQRDLAVRATVVSGSSRTAQFVVQNDYDIEASSGTDAASGTGVLAGAIGTTDTAFPMGDITTGNAGFNQISIAAGTLTASRATASPSGLMGIGASNVLLASWELEAKGEAVELQRADFDIAGTSAIGDFTGSIRLLVSDVANDTSGQSVYTVTASSATFAFDDDNSGTDQVTFSSYYTIPANSKRYLKLIVDTSSSMATTDTAQGRLSDIYFKRVLTGTYTTTLSGGDTDWISGNVLQGSGATLTTTPNTSLASKQVVEGQPDVVIGSYYLQTGSTEGVNVSSVAVRLAFAGNAAVANVSNLKLWKKDPTNASDVGKQIGTTTSSLAAVSGGFSTNTVTVSGELDIPANTTVKVDVLLNTSTSTSDGGTDDTIITSIAAAGISGSGKTSGTTATSPSAAQTSATMTIVEGGNLTIAVETSGAASSQFVTTGVTGFEMARLKLSSTVEDMKLEQLTLRTLNGSTNIASVKLLGTGLTSDPSVPVTSGSAVFSFPSGSEITVPANGTRVLTVQVSTTGLQTLVAGNFGVLGFGTMNARGSGSGTVAQENFGGTQGTNYYVAGTNAYSGDLGDVIYFTATADAGTSTSAGFYMVTTDDDAVNLATGDLDLQGEATDTSWTAGDAVVKLSKVESVIGTANAGTNYEIGDLVYLYDSDDNEAGFAIVTTRVASGAAISGLGFSPAGSIAIAAATDYVTKITNANSLVGNTMRYEEVEPVITKKTFTQEAQTSEATVAMYEVKAEGSRDMTFNSLTLEKSGSNSPAANVVRYKLYDGNTLLSEVVTTTVAGTSDDGGTNGVNANTTFELCTGDTTGAVGEAGNITAAEAATISVGDTITVTASGGADTDTSTVVVNTIGGAIAACNGAETAGAFLITASGNVTWDADDTTISIANNRVHFNASQANTGDTALAEQTITAGQTKTLTVKADLSNVRFGLAAGNTATFSLTIPGSAGPLRVAAASATSTGDVEGLNWDYTPLNTAGAAVYRTEGDSYPVTGQGLTY